ncbi:hypothetical protein Smp_150130 [Schistosoma mansoni]|uniref:hypothetical protein n=1 Tax=Schistosoma mansoni TaxID=6183 RepID=UPI00022DC194|nr:hypothetical protein Smp_150130 [Schistosoma mansoni]|eukprot:XP_018651663.1 hypothetical protein Smp_150130 [Schistosoma mansoni]
MLIEKLMNSPSYFQYIDQEFDFQNVILNFLLSQHLPVWINPQVYVVAPKSTFIQNKMTKKHKTNKISISYEDLKNLKCEPNACSHDFTHSRVQEPLVFS